MSVEAVSSEWIEQVMSTTVLLAEITSSSDAGPISRGSAILCCSVWKSRSRPMVSGDDTIAAR